MRTLDELARTGARRNLRLESSERVAMPDGSSALSAKWSFEDPWDAARFLKDSADEDATDPVVRAWALEMLRQAGRAIGEAAGPDVSPRLADAFAQTVQSNVKREIKFIREPLETFQSARVTMALGAGDCDDHARLVHALTKAGGVPAYMRFFTLDEQPVHVVEALTAKKRWAETTIPARYGEHPHAALARLVRAGRADRRPDLGGIGSLLGAPTIAELADLVRAVDYQVQELDTFPACASAPATWAATTHRMAASWYDYRAAVTARIAAIPDALQTSWPANAGGDWDAVRRYVGAFQAQDRALRAAGCPGPDYAAMPGPTRSDLDLTAYNFAGRVLHATTTAGDVITNPWTWGAVAAVAIGAWVGSAGLNVAASYAGARRGAMLGARARR